MAEYVAGSLSALFGKKCSGDDAGGGGVVKLTHVKQMYEEFEPRKPPRIVGRKLNVQEQQRQRESSQGTKRKFSDGNDKSEVSADKKGRFVYKLSRTDDSKKANEDCSKTSEDVPDKPRKNMTNKEAALFRIGKKKLNANKSGETETSEKKTKKVKKNNPSKETDEIDTDVSNNEENSDETKSSEDQKRNFRYYEDDPTYIPQTIFVKNLPPKTQRKQIKKLFANCGDILFVRFTNAVPAKASIPVEAAIKKRSLIKEGTTICSYVVFADAMSVSAALKLNGIEFEGHHLRIDKREASPVPPKRSVFCGNIPFDTTDDELWEYFAEAGEIDYVRVVRNNLTGEGKGIAFVVFKESAAALMALEFSGRSFKSRTIRVTAIEKKRPTGGVHSVGIATSRAAQIGGGSKERINKRKMEKKSIQQERKQKGSKERSVGKMGKLKREKIKKNIKREKASKFKKNFAKKLQGMNS